MKRTYLVVFEKGDDSWSAFAPDIAGTGGMGDTFEEARQSLREGLGYMFEHNIETGLPIPDAVAKSVDFSEFDPNPANSHYEIEWMTVEVPQVTSDSSQSAQQAA